MSGWPWVLGGGLGLLWLSSRSQSAGSSTGSSASANGGGGLDAPAVPGSPAAGVAFDPARTVTMREPFHFRPRAVAEPIGPELPAGTRLEIGDTYGVNITRGSGARLEHLLIARRSNGDAGYVFLPHEQALPFLEGSASAGSSTSAKPLSGFDPRAAIAGEGPYARRY